MRVLFQCWVNEVQITREVPFLPLVRRGGVKPNIFWYAPLQPITIHLRQSCARWAQMAVFTFRPSPHLCWKPWKGVSYGICAPNHQILGCYRNFCLHYIHVHPLPLRRKIFFFFFKFYWGFWITLLETCRWKFPYMYHHFAWIVFKIANMISLFKALYMQLRTLRNAVLTIWRVCNAQNFLARYALTHCCPLLRSVISDKPKWAKSLISTPNPHTQKIQKSLCLCAQP